MARDKGPLPTAAPADDKKRAIEVLKALAGSLLMAAQIVVGTVGNAPQLTPAGAEGELVLDVGGSPGIEGQLRRLMIPQTQGVFLDAQRNQPVLTEVLPVGEPRMACHDCCLYISRWSCR